VSTIRYVGHGAEIEDDAGRLSRHRIEFAGDVARWARQSKPRWGRRGRGPISAMSAVVARWR
jgi:hypothetical protein